MNAFTPGPWHIAAGGWGSSGGNEGGFIMGDGSNAGTYYRDNKGDVQLIPGQGLFIATYNTTGPNCPGEEVGRANARLIAAAPDLLEALYRIAAIRDKTEGGDWDEITEARGIACDAIAKATGEKA